jgi:ABC-type sugar transport system substrate-binding protein
MVTRARTLRAAGAAALVLGLVLVAAGCGSSNNSTTSSGATSTGAGATASAAATAPGVKEAQAASTALLQRPTKIAVTVPVGKPIPKGKHIALMQCGFPGCIPLGDHVRAAAKSLGWSVTTINTGLTPETVKTGWDKAVSIKPDGVVTMVYESAAFASELAALKAAKVPVVDCCVPEAAHNGLDLSINALPNAKVIGKAMASYVVGSRQDKAVPLAVDVGGLPIAQTVNEAFKAEYNRLLPGAKIQNLTVPATSIGKDAPTRIVGYLRSHPDVNLIVMSQTDPAVGLPAALKAAGLSTPIFGEGANPTIYQYIRAGQMEGTVAFDDYGVGYAMVDGLVRLFTGGNLQDSNVNMPRWVLTKDNIPPGNTFPVVADNDQQFLSIWGVQ